ncbi:MAG: hypothetical protein HY794_08710 [Desulfarculus sp.]|nr:hypothetical protein [Desulfarculus sp.]
MGNTQVNGRYIFGGTRTDSQAVSDQILAETPATLVGSHTGSGRLYGQGTYTGLYSRNITLTVDAAYPGGVPSALNPMDVDYSYVDDFGRAISGTATLTGTGSGNALALGDGVSFHADSSSFVAGEQYTLALGRQHGNTEIMEANLSQENRMSFNHTLQQIFGAEGNSGGAWNNLLDQLANWKDALDKDSKTQTYFESVPATTNNLASTADLRVSGDWDDAQYRSYTFVTGGPLQSDSTAASRAAYRNFTVDLAYLGGVPSVANPMTVNYEWFDSSGPGWTATTVNITGTGAGNSVTLQNLGAVPFTGSGDAPADVQSLNPPGEMTLRLNAGGTLMDGDSWDLTLQQYNQGQTESQEMLTSLAAVRTNLLRYTGDVGAKLNRLEVRDNLLGSDNLQLEDRLARVESADISQVAIGLQQYQTLYQASLQATAMVMGRSLADYI